MKYLVLSFALLAAASPILPKTYAAEPSKIEIRKIEPMDSHILEEWERITDHEDILGVGAYKMDQPKWKWRVSITVAEFIRSEPLESELVAKITSALNDVKGVKSAVQGDREVWVIKGNPIGEALVRAVSVALDSLAPRLIDHVDSLGNPSRIHDD